MKQSILEGLKELIRTGLIAAIPVLIDGLGAGVVDWKLVAISGTIAILRGLDKLLHTEGVRSPLDLRWVK